MRSFTTTIFLAVAAWSQTGPLKTPADPNSPQYVGTAACQTCHGQGRWKTFTWDNFVKNPHYKSIASGTEAPEKSGCESCHGPGKAHVEAWRTDPAKAARSRTIIVFQELSSKATLDNCLECHGKDINRAEIRRSEHSQSDVSCTSCHSIHNSPTPKFLLAKKQINLCYDCHGQVRAQFNMPSKHRVNEGVMTCTDCHNPHGAPAPTWRMSARPRMVDQGLVNEQPCLRCHTDKRGPFLFEHVAVRVDGCEACHFPHGSTNARLLKRPVMFTLCLECHTGQSGFGRTGQGIPTQSPSHNMADPKYRNCTTCHVRIHGSNADERFLR